MIVTNRGQKFTLNYYRNCSARQKLYKNLEGALNYKKMKALMKHDRYCKVWQLLQCKIK